MSDSQDALWRAARKLAARGGGRKGLPPMLFFTDPARGPDPESVLAHLPRGSAIVFRAFGDPDALAVGLRLTRLARRRGVRVFVGADARLAAALRADGLHLPERLGFKAGEIATLRGRFIITTAAHSGPAIARARRAGASAVVVSPIFPSRSPSAGEALGLRRFTKMIRGSGIPAYALGGINSETIRGLGRSGAVGLAAVDAFGPEPRSPRLQPRT